MITRKIIADKTCYISGSDAPNFLLLQPVDDHDLKALDTEMTQISQRCRTPYLMTVVKVSDWNAELSPWQAPAVWGDDTFSGRAQIFLDHVLSDVLPEILQQYGLKDDIKVVLGGYSLAGLFALWAATRTDRFCGIAAASPSVWFPGWLDYLKAHPVHVEAVYLSLGGKEEKTKKRLMATVGDNIRAMPDILKRQSPDMHVKLEFNPGGHFRDAALRTAKAFANVMENC